MFLFVTCITAAATTFESWANHPLSSDLHLQGIRYEAKAEYNNKGKIYQNTLQNTCTIVQLKEFMFYYSIPVKTIHLKENVFCSLPTCGNVYYLEVQQL